MERHGCAKKFLMGPHVDQAEMIRKELVELSNGILE